MQFMANISQFIQEIQFKIKTMLLYLFVPSSGCDVTANSRSKIREI